MAQYILFCRCSPCMTTYTFFFFFSSRRRHTRFDCDWSSDVCSSDLDARWSHRLQATSYAAKDYRLDGKTGFGRYDTRGYTTVDLISQWKIDPKNRVSLGVEKDRKSVV